MHCRTAPATVIGQFDIAAAIVVATFCCAACSSDRVSSRATVFRDSAGISIVENHDTCWLHDAGWRVSAVPVTTIGARAGEPAHELFRVSRARRLGDGRILVTNGGTREVRFFDSGGDFLYSFGGQGEGPGEFDDISDVFLTPEDSIFVYESTRVSVFDSSGQFVRTYPTLVHLGNTRPAVGMFDDRSILLDIITLTREQFSGTHVWHDSATYYRLQPDGALTDTIGKFFSEDMFIRRSDRGGGQTSSLPFGRTGHVALSGDHFIFGTTHAHEYRTYTPTGVLRQIVRLERVTTAIPDERLDSARTDRLGRARSPESREAMETMIQAAAAQQTLPAFSDLTTDTEGHVWIEEYGRPPGDPATWLVFGSDGVCAGAVQTPVDLAIFEIGLDYLIGETTDTMGVERVELYGLQR